MLGKGSYGEVSAIENVFTSKVLAQKEMNKARIKNNNAEHLILNERRFMALVDSPFVMPLKHAFQTETSVYLVMEIMVILNCVIFLENFAF